MLYAKLIGRIALFTCENLAHIEFYLQGLLPKILVICTIKTYTVVYMCDGATCASLRVSLYAKLDPRTCKMK